jgi:hypothetical protein
LMVAGLALVTALPVLSSTLLTDIFAGLSVFSLHLLIFHRSLFAPMERIGLFLLIAFAAATHSATLAALLAVLVLAVPILLVSRPRPLRVLVPAGGAIATGAAMLLAANLALSGQLAWTPGGFGIAFGRMLQDGIVKRYLDDHCPTARLKLCPHRNELPATADDFLWSNGVFNELGRFSGLGEEMRSSCCTVCKNIRCSKWNRPCGLGKAAAAGCDRSGHARSNLAHLRHHRALHSRGSAGHAERPATTR